MLTELRLINFRCFKDHVIPLRRNTIIVGKNNAGKSTVIDALRLVSCHLTTRNETWPLSNGSSGSCVRTLSPASRRHALTSSGGWLL